MHRPGLFFSHRRIFEYLFLEIAVSAISMRESVLMVLQTPRNEILILKRPSDRC